MSLELQAAMADTILHGDPASRSAVLAASSLSPLRTLAALHVHASTTRHTLTQALAEAFPTVERALGPARFADIAQAFIRQHPPRQAALLAWGDELPNFLEDLLRDEEIADLARLDRAWFGAFTASEAPVLPRSALTHLSPELLTTARLMLHPSVMVLRLKTAACSAWSEACQLAIAHVRREADANGRFALLARPGAEVRLVMLSIGTFEFIAALRKGASLLEALTQALDAEGGFDLKEVLPALFADEIFSSIQSKELP